jgi:hypothetical protein
MLQTLDDFMGGAEAGCDRAMDRAEVSFTICGLTAKNNVSSNGSDD